MENSFVQQSQCWFVKGRKSVAVRRQGCATGIAESEGAVSACASFMQNVNSLELIGSKTT